MAASTNKIKILIAEDEVDALNIMAERISAEGYEVLLARDGEEALEQIRSESPDLIILDLMMPRVDGFTVLKNLREHHTSDKWQPVIIVSARKDVETFSEDFFSISDLYIQKPCYVADVLKAVKFMLTLKDQGTEFGGLARDQ